MSHSRVTKGLRALALFEAVKGATVLVVGFGLLALVGKDVEAFAEDLVSYSHLDPASRYPRIFVDLAAHLDDAHLWMYAAFAFVYAAVRFAEGYGLWKERAWAEWFAALSAGLYIPVELWELIRHHTWLKVLLLGTNTAIVAFLVKVLVNRRKIKALSSPAAPSE